MKFLIKLFCLLSFLSSFAFSSNTLLGFDDDNFPAGDLTTDDIEFFDNYSYAKYKSNNEFYYILSLKPSSWGDLYYFGKKRKSGVYGSFSSGAYLVIENYAFSGRYAYSYNMHSYYEFTEEERNAVISYFPIKYLSAEIIFSCPTGTNFGINSKKCYPVCPAGESWDYKNEVCYSDCTDKNLNKFGYSNGTSQGGCVDCSNAFTDHDIASCICSGFGTTLSEKGAYFSLEGSSFVSYNCANGSDITFKRRSNENPNKDKDNNSTNSSDKDKENPKPDKDKDNPNPDKKDNNENSNNSSGEAGNSSNNNSGGSSGNGSSGGGGTGVETKPNPNYKGDGKEDGKGEEGKGDDAVAGKLDYGDLKKDADKFKSDFKGALDDVISKAQDFKNSLDGIISKIKEGGLAKFNQSSIPSTCPLSFEIDFVVSNKQIIFDICKVLAPVSQTLYYFFYIAFFILFLLLIVKLFLFTFMGL